MRPAPKYLNRYSDSPIMVRLYHRDYKHTAVHQSTGQNKWQLQAVICYSEGAWKKDQMKK